MNSSIIQELFEELNSDGFEKTVLFGYKNISYSDNAVIKVFRTIEDFNLPILVHVDIPFIEDFIHALEKCKNVKFIWAHTAYDFTKPFGGIENKPEMIEMLLVRFENLLFDISMWKISPIFFMDEKWIQLLEKYNDRFLFGTDMTDQYILQSVWLKGYELIFEKLNRESLTKITKDNILKLCNYK